MLEKLAEIVREQNSIYFPVHPCCNDCQDYYDDCQKECKNPGFIKAARWAVLLVAQALPNLAEVDRTNGVDLGDVEALGWDFMDLYYEAKKAEASSDGCKCQKQAEEVAE